MTQEQAEVVLKVNSKEAQDKLEKLEAQAKDLRIKFAEAFKKGDTKSINDINKQLQRTNKEINSMRTNAANIRAAMVRLNEASPKELNQTIKQINAELNSGRVKRGSKEWDYYIAQLKKVKAELKTVQAETKESESWLSRINGKINNWGTMAAGAMAGFAGVVMSGKAAVQAYADMQAEEANVRKYTGMTTEEVEQLNEAFKNMDTRTSREDLNKLAQEAGRLGKQSVEDVLGFVKAADQLNVALDDLGDGATLTLSKLTGIFGIEDKYGTEKSLLKVGSIINELSQNCSASAPYLAEFTSRLGGIAAQSKMTIDQVMAFGAVLDTQNMAVEASSTALGQVITKIYQDPAKIAKAAGLDVKEFSKLVKSDMNEALITLFEQLNKFGGMENLALIFDEMGTDGARAIPVLSALAGHIDELKNQQIEATKAFDEGISVTNEFAVQNNTVQAGLDKAKKGFKEVAVSLGEKLVPVMGYAISGTSLLMKTMLTLVNFFIKYKTAIISLTAAVAAYTVVLNLHTIKQNLDLALRKARVALMAVEKAGTTALTIVTSGLSVAYYTMTGNTVKATAATRAFSAACAATPIGALATAIGVAIGAYALLDKKVDDVTVSLDTLSKGEADANAKLKEEQSILNTNISKLENFNGTKKEEHDLIDKLNTKYGTFFGKCKTLKEWYEKLTKSGQDYCNSIYQQILMEAKRQQALDLAKQAEEARQNGERGEGITNGDNIYEFVSNLKYVLSGDQLSWAEAKDEVYRKNKKKWDDYADYLDAEAQKLMEDVASEMADVANPFQGSAPTEEPSDESPSKPLSAPVNAKKQEKEAKKAAQAAQKALREDLKKQKAIRDQAIAEAQQEYNSEAITYDEYCAKKEDAELQYFEAVKAILAKKGLTESALYADMLKKEEELRTSSLKRIQDNQLKTLKAQYVQQSTQLDVQYRTGEISYLEYIQSKDQLDKEYLENQLKLYQNAHLTETTQYAELLKKQEDIEEKARERQRKKKEADVNKTHTDNVNSSTEDFYNPKSAVFNNEKALNQALLAEDVRYLKEKMALYSEGSEEWVALNKELNERIAKDQLDKQKETAEAYNAFQEQYGKLSGSEREKIELEVLKSLKDQELITEAQYEKAVSDLRKKYRDKDQEDARDFQNDYADMLIDLYNSVNDVINDIGKQGEDFWADWKNVAEATVKLVTAGLSQAMSYASAERDLEIAKIEKQYDTEIEKAGNNSKKVSKLEEQKEAAVAKIKKKYNEKEMKMEIAQAVAQTALSAITAYASASKVAWWLGPVAAAMATAAGMVQVATIKKQHEAEAAGYYTGGFTQTDADNRKEVGVVHANEFVANHDAVKNSALTPVLRLIDTAQKNNTVGSLTAEDVSNALGQGSGVSVRGVAAQSSDYTTAVAGSVALMAETTSRTSAALDRLSQNIEDGIETYMVMDGERGFAKKYSNYQKLTNNPKR